MEFTIKLSKTAFGKLRKAFLLDEAIEKATSDEDILRSVFYIILDHNAELDLQRSLKITKISND